PASFLKNHVHGIAEAADGAATVGTRSSGYRVTGKGQWTQLFDEIVDVLRVRVDPAGTEWFATADHGLFRRPGGGEIARVPLSHYDGANIMDVAFDHEGHLWAAIDMSLRCYDGTTFELIESFDINSQPQTLMVDRHGVLWIGTGSRGL